MTSLFKSKPDPVSAVVTPPAPAPVVIAPAATAEAPAPQPVAPMPNPNSAAVIAAQDQARRTIASRAGRASTNLTGPMRASRRPSPTFADQVVPYSQKTLG